MPIASGNKDFWAAGNWLGHLVSRVVGADAYDQALSGEASFDTPEWKQAFGYIEELHEHGCVNESANAIDDNEGAQLFFQEKAAMHAIGSWLVSWAIDEAPDLTFDFVNLPAMPDEVDAEQRGGRHHRSRGEREELAGEDREGRRVPRDAARTGEHGEVRRGRSRARGCHGVGDHR